MKFQSFVPEAAREYLSVLLYGNSESEKGLSELLKNYAKLVALEEQWNLDLDAKSEGEPEDLLEIRSEMRSMVPVTGQTWKQMHDRTANSIEIIKRLGEDKRMQPAYSMLIKELQDEKQWRRFLRAAWASKRDYREHRDELKQASDLARDVAKLSNKLAELLLEIQSLELENKPHQFFNIRHLLYETDSEHSFGYHFDRWKSLRHLVVGDHYPLDENLSAETNDSESYPAVYLVEEYEKQITAETEAIADRSGDAQAGLHLAWCSAPQLPALLKTVASAAGDYSPKESGFIGVAIDSRKSILKTEYIRAFDDIITQDNVITPSTNIKKAIAIISNVVLNDPEIDVSYDDVRKALA